MTVTSLPTNLTGSSPANTGDGHAAWHNRVHKDVTLNAYVDDYGAVGDGSTDDATAIQAAIDACASGGRVLFGPKTYLVASKLTLTEPNVTIQGVGHGASVIKATSATVYALEIDDHRIVVRDMKFLHTTSTATNGGAIHLKSGGYSQILFCTFDGGWYENVHVTDAYAWNVIGCYLFNAVNAEIYHDSVISPDQGDSSIVDCEFATTNSTTYAIYWTAGGGLRVIGNKINQHAYGILADITAGITTSGLYVHGNSLENQTSYAIRVKRAGVGGTLHFVQITGNEIGNQTGDGVSLETGGVQDALVAANVLNLPNTKTAIAIVGGVSKSAILSNLIGGALVGIATNSSGACAVVGNSFYGCTTNVQDEQSLGAVGGAYDHLYRLKLPDTTSTAAYTTILRLDLNDYRSVMLELTFDLLLDGVGRVARYVQKLVNIEAASGAATVTAIADVAAGAVFDLQFDTGTNGSVIVGCKRNAGAGGTTLYGQVHVRLLGSAKAVKPL